MSYGIKNNPSMPLNYWLEGLKNQYKETKVKTATFIKKLDDFRGDARLYKLSEPLLKESYDWDDQKIKAGYNYVVVSAVNVEFSGPETYIFGADENGKVLEWGELPGSFRGSRDHPKALNGAGYDIVE